jgi:predicted extracellular nuclease
LSTDQGAATSAPVSATDADSKITDAAIATPVAGISLDDSFSASTADGQPGSTTLTVAESTAAGEYDVVITFNNDDAQSVTCTVAVTVFGPAPQVKVHDVQGSGAASPRTGERVAVEAIVTSVITSRDVPDGFFVQEEDADTDSDPATSEGVYVFCRATCPSDLVAGDRVRVTGVVSEFNDSTQLDTTGAGTRITRTATAQALPAAAVVPLPAGASTRAVGTFENVEGMRTTIPTTLAVSEYFNLARFGELVLTANERPYQFTETNAPSAEGYAAHLAELAKRRIVLDDDSNDQNDATSGPKDNEPYYYPTPGLSAGNYVRGGDTITGLTGVFEYSFGAWKLRPVTGASYTFERTNPRPASPEQVGGRLKVASFNVLNYFATIDTTPSNDNGACAPSGTADCRGADSEIERQRQLDKIVAALVGIDADVFGLIEIQNDDGAATQQIVDALNATTTAGTYDYVRTGPIGTDAIKQAFVYKRASVTPVGDHQTLTTADDPRFVDTRNRPALIQTFAEVASNERVTIAVNHFKSKGSGCGDGDDSPADGSGNCDGTRTKAAQALADHLATDPTRSGDSDYLIIGDLNSYSMERPITTLQRAGFIDLLDRFDGERSYGYVFDGQLGHLDHALASPSLNGQVTGAGGWKINADEVPLLDYNDTVKDTGEADFERKSSANELYSPDPYRSSDHDPVVVGLALNPADTRPLRLTLLHNNDGESALLPVAPRGGVARFGTLVEDLRDEAAAEPGNVGSLLLSSGDNFLAGPQLQASLENYDGDTDYSDDGPFYDAVALDRLGYDASAVGNHEFDFGPKALGYFISQFKDSNIRFVSSNLDVTGEKALEQFVAPAPGTPGTLVEWTRADVNGRKVAIVGATTPRLPSISSPGPDVEAREDVRGAVQDAITKATADGTNVVVLIAHLQNITEDRALVGQLRDLDVVIAGGGDELLANPDDVLLPGAGTPFGPYPLQAKDADNVDVPIVTTQGSYGYLGRLILDVDGAGKVTSVSDRSGPVRNVFNATTPRPTSGRLTRSCART